MDEKLTQCADSIDTQHNVLFAIWVKYVKKWFEDETCTRRKCICKEPGFFEIKTQKELWDFFFSGECGAQADPTRRLPSDDAEPKLLRLPCVSAECDKHGCLKDKLERWLLCPVQQNKACCRPYSTPTTCIHPALDRSSVD